MKKVLLVMISIMILTCYSCREDELCSGFQDGKILPNLYGCGLNIELDNGMRLEPTNLSDFDMDFQVGQRVSVVYHEISGGSYCMNGKIVEIDCLNHN